MARVDVPVSAIARTGVVAGSTGTEVAGDATNDHIMVNDGRTFIHARNSGASSRTLTLTVQQTVDGYSITATAVTIAAGATKLIGPFPSGVYNVQSGSDAGKLYFAVSHAELVLQAWQLNPVS